MGLVNLIVGLFLIGLGFLVKAAPDLIAGYNTIDSVVKKLAFRFENPVKIIQFD